MKKIIYTQRVEYLADYGERRDCAHQKIPELLYHCGYCPIPVPNVPGMIEQFVEEVRPQGILLTGGNSLVKYGGDAPEKDETDCKMIEIAIRKKIPLYGFCRGMQSVLDFYGCELESVKNHVALKHTIQYGEKALDVNSYHNQAARKVSYPVQVLARTEDGVIEAVAIEGEQIIATMWHPERENPFQQHDIERIQELFR